MPNFEDRPTLTQRRSRISQADIPEEDEVVEVPKFQRISRRRVENEDEPVVSTMTEERRKSNGIKGFIRVLFALALVFVLFYIIKLPPTKNTTDNTDNAVEPTTIKVQKYFNDDLRNSSEAKYMQVESSFSISDKKVGEKSESSYTVYSFEGVKYDTFTRFSFRLDKEGGFIETDKLPEATATYDAVSSIIKLKIYNTKVLDFVIEVNEKFNVNTKSINSFYRDSVEEEESKDDKFVIQLNSEAQFVLHYEMIDDIPTLFLDIKESYVDVEHKMDDTEEVVDTTLTPTPNITATKSQPSDGLSNEYSKDPQTLGNGLTTDSTDLSCIGDKCLYWEETSAYFLYEKPVTLSQDGKYPNVSAKIVDDKLMIEFTNLVSKNATSDLTFPKAKMVGGLHAVRSGNTLKYEIPLNGQREYKILFTESKNFDNANVFRLMVK